MGSRPIYLRLVLTDCPTHKFQEIGIAEVSCGSTLTSAGLLSYYEQLLRKLLPATPRARADEPDVGIPHILKRILRISLLARTVNREPALFWANHGLTGSNRFVGRISTDNALVLTGLATFRVVGYPGTEPPPTTLDVVS
jgi:hypothetical protein